MAGFVENLLSFTRALRDQKVGVTTENVLDALRGVPLIDMHEKEDFYSLLKCTFVSNREELKIFNELFPQFWSLEDPSRPLRTAMEALQVGQAESDMPPEREPSTRSALTAWDAADPRKTPDEEKETPGYSMDEVLGKKDFGLLDTGDLERVREFVLLLSKKMGITLSRRWKRGRRGDQIDFRNSIRRSMKYGGEMLELRSKHLKPRPLRLVLCCDVSGSMDVYNEFFLLFMFTVQKHYRHCETFVFSTRLSQLTSLLKRRDFDEMLQLISGKVTDWSGGTNIGNALHQLRQRHSALLNPDRTALLLFSDGWDRGDASLLDSEMKSVKRAVKRIIWLNPLLASPEYRPICKGMATALPYVDHFLPCHNVSSLKHLAHVLTKV